MFLNYREKKIKMFHKNVHIFMDPSTDSVLMKKLYQNTEINKR